MKQYSSVVLGGTFDKLHFGHQTILKKAFEVGEHVTIGLTTDSFIHRFKIKSLNIDHSLKIENCELKIASYAIRKHNLEMWLHRHNYLKRASIVPLNDPYGPTVVEIQKTEDGRQTNDYEAIIVSTETRHRGEEINQLRTQNGLPGLVIIEIPMVRAEDEDRISSTRIRNGEIDGNGNLVLPESLRSELRKPIGTVISNEKTLREIAREGGVQIVSVGDKTTEAFLELGIKPDLSIVDLLVERRPYHWDKTVFDSLREHAEVNYIKSGPGSISSQAMRVIQRWATGRDTMAFKGDTLQRAWRNRVLIVDGEEDLLVLPVLLYAPLGTTIYYGQPAIALSDSEMLAGQPKEGPPRLARQSRREAGIVRVVVTEGKKQLARRLLKKFTH